MPKLPAQLKGDQSPVIGGVSLPSSLIAPFPDGDVAPNDDLGRQAYWLLKLNSDKVALRFRQSDLNAMDDDTKRMLIADIQHALGVKPFQKDVL